MTQSINKVTLIGNLGKDPELRYTPGGKPVATLSVATSTRTKNRQTNEWEDVTQWHRVTVLGDAAEWAGQKLTKGRTVYVEGSLKYGSYTQRRVSCPHYPPCPVPTKEQVDALSERMTNEMAAKQMQRW